jgi:serine/threonine protein kinase
MEFPFLRPPQGPNELGRLGPYRILKLLGQGGMGIVFLAQDTELGRLVALKVMRPELSGNTEPLTRFLREARAIAALKSDHIITIYQVDQGESVPFFTMELLKGKSLAAWLGPDRVPSIEETLMIAKQIAKGLAVAHRVGIIHRDLKPANVWLEAPKGRIKILDFGIARLVEGEQTPLTEPRRVIGTAAFMAPEQARGETVDHRCDLFSLGCILYRMVTGRPPFQGDNALAILAALASDNPRRVLELNPESPAGLADLIDRLLVKDPSGRPSSTQEVVETIQQIEKEWKQRLAIISTHDGENASAGPNAALPPRIRAAFVLDSNQKPLMADDGRYTHYRIRLSVENVPDGTYNVTYGLHESYGEPLREVSQGPTYEEDITAYGLSEVKALIRYKKTFDLVAVNMWDALQETYRDNQNPEIVVALEMLQLQGAGPDFA